MKYDFKALNQPFHNNSVVKGKTLLVVAGIVICFVAVMAFVIIEFNIKSPTQENLENESRLAAEEESKYYTTTSFRPPSGVQAVSYNGCVYYSCPGVEIKNETFIGEYLGDTVEEMLPLNNIKEGSKEIRAKDFMRFNCSAGLHLYSYIGDEQAIIIKNGTSTMVLLQHDRFESLYEGHFKDILNEWGVKSLEIKIKSSNETVPLSEDSFKSVIDSKVVSFYKTNNERASDYIIRGEIQNGLMMYRSIEYDSMHENVIIYDNIKSSNASENFPYEANLMAYVIYDKDIMNVVSQK